MSLRGFAQRMLGDLTRDQLTNYESVLTQRFNPTKRETTAASSRTENDYPLKRLASRAFPTIPSSLREGIIVEQYINGLGSQEIKRHGQFAPPTSLDRAISLAREFEAFEGDQNKTPRKPKDTEFQSVLAFENNDQTIILKINEFQN